MEIDIENINTIEKRQKYDTKRWRTIYEVIQQEFFFMKLTSFRILIFFCKNNINEAHNIPIEVKNNIKLMSMEQVLYAQVVMLHRKDLNITEANKIKVKLNSSSKASLQDHSVGFILILIRLK